MKSRSKRARLPRRDLEQVRARDPAGAIVVHHRTIDSLERMLRAGTIDDEMYSAARDFQAAFIVAHLDSLRAMPMTRIPGTGREPEFNERQLDARRRVHEAMDSLGGIGSPGGSAVWSIVGLQHSIREWSLGQGWSGRPVRQEQAQGILIAALGMLAGYFGYRKGRRAS
jgi:hypothetical protein